MRPSRIVLTPAEGRLSEARRLAHEGRHAEALAEYQWFHAHALDESPALHGVRLSYALGGWADLAAVYPPARAALDAQRERDTARLLACKNERGLFHDVLAIHRVLGEQWRTHALFADLARSAPELAMALAPIGLPAIVAAGDHALAHSLVPDAEGFIRGSSRSLITGFAGRRRRFTRAPRIAAHIHNYATDVRHMLAVLEGVGQHLEAARLRRLATDLVHATTIRRAVRAALQPGARPWYARGRYVSGPQARRRKAPVSWRA
ncbi:hypothetical protein [Massilia sp. MS-15]|uniref:hypothetical protein n=1 Tax=Massilia sp. MS-15 TaxID=2878200 RepID=UPI001CD59D24|nr:hypothetical protein [Massilia sp. MS-15]MCA1246005.1 hypothetical protein [Massilia sp. MS-15]